MSELFQQQWISAAVKNIRWTLFNRTVFEVEQIMLYEEKPLISFSNLSDITTGAACLITIIPSVRTLISWKGLSGYVLLNSFGT